MKSVLRILVFVAWFAIGSYAQGEAKPKAYIFAEFKVATANNLAFIWEPFVSVLENENAQGYIINYGSKPAVRGRRKLFTLAVARSREYYDPPRITFIDGPPEKSIRTIMWIVPQGAELPEP